MKIKDAYLNHKGMSGYLTVVYEDENEACVMEHTMSAPLYISPNPSIDMISMEGEMVGYSVDFGFGMLDNAEIHSKIIEEKVKEMTIEDIEKELGHKVKIVGER